MVKSSTGCIKWVNMFNPYTCTRNKIIIHNPWKPKEIGKMQSDLEN